jgi:ACS family glucarate transporter-like MFS transporter
MSTPELTDLASTAASATPAQRPSAVRYRVLALGCSLAVLTYLHRVGFARALPELHLNAEHSSWLTAAFLVAYGLFEMPCGLLGDRLGTRHLITVLVLGWSLTTGLVALASPDPGALLLTVLFLVAIRFLFGMFQAGAFPLLSRMLTDWMPARERASAQGTVWMASRLGGLIAPWTFTLLLLVCGSWQTPLWILAGVGCVWCAGFWPWFRNRPEDAPAVNEAERSLIVAHRAARPLGHGRVPWGLMLRSRSVWGLWLMYGCCGFAANFYVTLLPDYLERQRHLGKGLTSWLSSLPFACGMITCLAGGLFSDWIIRRTGNRKWGRRLSGLVGLSLGAGGWLAVNAVQTPLALGLVLCFIFFCNDLTMGPAWAACADIGERYAGTLGGAMNMLAAFLGAAGNLVAGYFFTGDSPELVFIIYACAYALGAACWLLVDVSQPLEPHRV